MKRSIITLVLFLITQAATVAQTFDKQRLGKEDHSNGVLARYTMERFENVMELTIFKNHQFYYQYNSTNYHRFSRGKWKRNKHVLILTSDIDSNNVPTQCLFFESDTIRAYFEGARSASNTDQHLYTTPVQVPINLKGELIPDAQVYINNDSTYCFPFFDTCIGPLARIERIKVHYGGNFKSKWMTVENKTFRRILCVAQVDIKFENYIALKNHRLKIEGRKLKSIDRF